MQSVIIAAHGSRNAEANAALLDLASATRDALGADVRAAYLEMEEPSIPTTIAAAVADGAQRIVLLPYFLHPGMHVRRDLVALLDDARLAHPAVTFAMADFFGNRPEVSGILATAAREALAAG